MGGYEVEAAQEVAQWLDALPDRWFGRVERHIDRLEEENVHLGFPYTSQLEGRLRELRFDLPDGAWRITYVIAGRKILLLTVFRKQRRRESAQIERAKRVARGELGDA
ncbi:MAG: type II toxin-antitoxin system RelE/ParE family toxin [Actinomycetota bacterium]|nr:type II toxin-antitoxin system RelE/ParE family toxin [Actinomycetota bacterium]